MMFAFRRLWLSAIFVITTLLFVPLASAQTIAGEIDGTVRDESGAVIANATVTITNVATNRVVRLIKTNSHGEYSAPLLPIGPYKITASAPGFERTDIVGIQLNVSDTLTFDAKLHPGHVEASVTVNATALAPNVQTSEDSSLIDDVQMRELALNTRNFEQMVLLQPGVTNQGPDESVPGLINGTGAANVHNISLNGLRQNQVSWTIDGSDIINPVGLQQVGVFPDVDSIAQIKVLRNSYGAQYGGGGSGQVTVATKGGGAVFHGDVFEFARTQYLDANDFQNLIATPQQPRSDELYHNFGYTIGGPLFIPRILKSTRNNTFFFLGQEFRRIRQGNPISRSNFPSTPQVYGYFAHSVCIQYASATSGTCTKQSPLVSNSPYAGYNYQVPSTSINAISRQYLNDVIIPSVTLQPINSPTDPQGILYSGESWTSENQVSTRIDHSFGSRVSIFGRYLRDPYHLDVPYGLFATLSAPGVSNAHVDVLGEDLELHGTVTITPTTVADFGYSFLEFTEDGSPDGFLSTAHSPDIQLNLPYMNTLAQVPSLTINGGTWTTDGPRHTRGHIQQAFENTTKQIRQHTFYLGANFEHTYVSDNSGSANQGNFSFTASKSGATTAFEQAFANFLTSRVNTFVQASVDAQSDVANNIVEFYLQDDWRATAHLTLNGGVRYSYFGQPYDEYGHLGGFDPEKFDPSMVPAFTSAGTLCIAGVSTGCTPNPNYSRLNGIITGGINSPFGNAITSQPMLGFAPRAGFAWDVYGNGRTSLRGGFGLFFNRTPESQATSEVSGNPEYVTTSTFNNVTFQQPAGIGAVVTAVPSISGTTPHWQAPYTEDYSLDIQQTIRPTWIFDLGYVGNGTFHLAGEEDLDQLPPGYAASLGGSLANFRPTSAAAEAPINYLLPYPGYAPITYFSTRFFSNYHSLQASTTAKFGKRNLINFNYTWSKAMTNSQNTSGFAPQNRFDLKPEWSPAAADRRHVFTADIVYELPFFLNRHDIGAKVLAGWEIAAIVQAVSGLPVDVAGTSVDSGGQGNLTDGDAEVRPDQTGNPNGPKTIAEYFNTSVYSLVPTGQHRPGNARHNSVEGPGYQTWNLTAARNFRMPRETRLQLRFEGFNAFNHVNSNSVSGTFNATSFGQITGWREMRKVQLGAKYYF